jgi:hypothetical protein
MDSHILPKWAYRRARDPAASNGSTNPILFNKGVVLQTSQQMHEHLLCEACEQLLSEDEDYVSRLAFQEDETLGLEAMFERAPFVPRSETGDGDGARAIEVSNLNCQSIARFAASVFWRAHVARRPRIDGLRLSETVARNLRRFVLRERALPTNICLIVLALVDDTETTPMRSLQSTTTMSPSTGEGTLNRYHVFIVSGLMFSLGISALAHPEICLACSSRPHALFQDWRKVRFAREGTERIVTGEKKGRLART